MNDEEFMELHRQFNLEYNHLLRIIGKEVQICSRDKGDWKKVGDYPDFLIYCREKANRPDNFYII